MLFHFFCCIHQFSGCALEVLSCRRYVPCGLPSISIPLCSLNAESCLSSGRSANKLSKVSPPWRLPAKTNQVIVGASLRMQGWMLAGFQRPSLSPVRNKFTFTVCNNAVHHKWKIMISCILLWKWCINGTTYCRVLVLLRMFHSATVSFQSICFVLINWSLFLFPIRWCFEMCFSVRSCSRRDTMLKEPKQEIWMKRMFYENCSSCL